MNKEYKASELAELVRGTVVGNPDAVVNAVNSLKLKEQEMTSYTESRKTQIRDMYTKLRGEVVDEIRKAVHNKAVLEGYTIVLDQSGESLNDVGFVIYVQPGLDITDSIIQDLNRGYRKNAKDPAGAAAADK